jgi:hypothetical protein
MSANSSCATETARRSAPSSSGRRGADRSAGRLSAERMSSQQAGIGAARATAVPRTSSRRTTFAPRHGHISVAFPTAGPGETQDARRSNACRRATPSRMPESCDSMRGAERARQEGRDPGNALGASDCDASSACRTVSHSQAAAPRDREHSCGATAGSRVCLEAAAPERSPARLPSPSRPSYVDPRDRHVVLLIDHANERPITLCVLRGLDANADRVAATQYPDRRKTWSRVAGPSPLTVPVAEQPGSQRRVAERRTRAMFNTWSEPRLGSGSISICY